MPESLVEGKTGEEMPVRLRGGPADGQLFHLFQPPCVLTYGADEACYVRVPTDGIALEYRFTPKQ